MLIHPKFGLVGPASLLAGDERRDSGVRILFPVSHSAELLIVNCICEQKSQLLSGAFSLCLSP